MGKNRGKQVDALLTKIEEKVNALLSKGLDEEKKNMSKNPIGKILLLGPGDSGKTTVLKQMKILHGDGFSDKDRREFKVKVYENIINAMKSIVMFAQYNGVDIENPSLTSYITSSSTVGLMYLNEDIVTAIKTLWKSEVVKAIYKRGNEFSLGDNCFYFFDNIERISGANYYPTNQDILMVRKQTTAMSETDFKIRGNICRFIDVGGQIKYRSRWHMFFDDAKAIFFIVSMASYDQMMEEDVKKNRMADSMELFSSTINNPLLRNVAVMLFLNKTDLVEKKLAYSSLRKHFIDLSSKKNETDIENAKSYFKYKFEILNANKTRRLYTSFTNSTDSRLMEKVINGILDIIINQNLASTGLTLLD